MIAATAELLRAHPWRWSLAIAVAMALLPGLDLAVAGWFYTPGVGFAARHNELGEFVRKGLPHLLIGSVIYVIVLWLPGEAMGRRFLGVDRRIAAYLGLSLALGPGLIVNTILKDNWGRARPSQIVEFGGEMRYTPPLLPADQCVDNCSFVSGHGALGFWVIAYALLAPAPWRPAAIAGALAFGAVIGLVRIAQGGHFLSDVLFSALITIGVTMLLHRWLIRARHQGVDDGCMPRL